MTFYNSIKDEVDGQNLIRYQKDIINQDLEKKKIYQDEINIKK